MSVKDSLCAVELFCELPDDLVDEVMARGSTLDAGPGVVLVKQGDNTEGMLMLVEGTADVEVDGRFVGTLSAGDYVGEMSLIDGAPRSATVTSGPTGVRVFRLSPLAMSHLIDQHPHTAVLLLKGLVSRVRRLESQAREGATH